ncbi:hypothetical protein D3C85_1235490 [compost metagenome]
MLSCSAVDNMIKRPEKRRLRLLMELVLTSFELPYSPMSAAVKLIDLIRSGRDSK